MNNDDLAYKKFLLKKQMKFLRSKKGFHTELITLMIPPNRKISDVTNYLKNEVSESSNIKSKLTRKNVIDSITALLQKLKTIREVPTNGLILFSGAIPQGNTAGTERNELYIIEPIEPVSNFKYHCASEFYLDPLEDMLSDKLTYGIIVIDNKDFAVGWVRGSHIEVVKTSASGVASRHHAGGQSQRRFERLFDEQVNYFYGRCSELTNEVFVSMVEQGILEGIFLGGSGNTKLAFKDKGLLDYRIRDKIIEIYDIGTSGEAGIRAVVLKAADKIANVQFIKEKKTMQRFLFNLSRENGLAAYGEAEVRDALERGAVDILLLSESLDMVRLTAECDQCGHTINKSIPSSKLESLEDRIKKQSCKECNSNQYRIKETYDMVEDLGNIAEQSGTKILMISTETEEGESLFSTFGGIAALLRYAIK